MSLIINESSSHLHARILACNFSFPALILQILAEQLYMMPAEKTCQLEN